ncbi:MAG TPA: hypothetical protein VH593_04335 [Ktedonobacteraceae bacterium]|jgi:NOL1/NOP2/fmu family ribosome biogenesis protein
MKQPFLARQGDILFLAIEQVPQGLKERKGLTIAEGEATGHRHQLEAGLVLEDAQSALFVEVLQATQVVHQEHRTIHLEPGFYRVIRQREFAPEAIRTVRD